MGKPSPHGDQLLGQGWKLRRHEGRRERTKAKTEV